MSTTSVIVLAIALGMDAFSVAIGIGTTASSLRQYFRLSWHFGLFQFFMPLIGWELGNLIARRMSGLAPWIACGILIFIGFRMIWETFNNKVTVTESIDKTKGWSLVMLSIAVSIDALGAGFSLRLMAVPLFRTAIIIGIFSCLMTLVGMLLGKMISIAIGQQCEVIGGVVLIIIGLKMVM